MCVDWLYYKNSLKFLCRSFGLNEINFLLWIIIYLKCMLSIVRCCIYISVWVVIVFSYSLMMLMECYDMIVMVIFDFIWFLGFVML